MTGCGMSDDTPNKDKAIRLVGATNAEGTLVPADQVCVSVDADGRPVQFSRAAFAAERVEIDVSHATEI